MNYKIKIRPKALKFIEKQDRVQRMRIYKAIYNLPNGDIKKLASCRDEDRLRVGDYRIIYQLNQNQLVILVTRADNRGQIYK